jgi:hypothetical protein
VCVDSLKGRSGLMFGRLSVCVDSLKGRSDFMLGRWSVQENKLDCFSLEKGRHRETSNNTASHADRPKSSNNNPIAVKTAVQYNVIDLILLCWAQSSPSLIVLLIFLYNNTSI